MLYLRALLKMVMPFLMPFHTFFTCQTLEWLVTLKFFHSDYSVVLFSSYLILNTTNDFKKITQANYMKMNKNQIKSFDDVLNKYIHIKDEIGNYPTTTYLKENGYYSLLHDINKFGGIYKVYDAIGLVPPRKPPAYWDNFENVKFEFKRIWDDTGVFPTYSLIRNKKVSGLIDAIKKHGGMKRLREFYNVFHVKKKREKKWNEFDTIVNTFRKLMHELGRFPIKQDFIDRGMSGIFKAINNHGGFYRLYESLGVEPNQKPKGYWKDINNIYLEIDQIIDNRGIFPSLEKMKSMGLSSMATAITKYHGGIKEIRKRYNAELKRVKTGYYSNFDKIKEVIDIFKNNNGHFPTISELDAYRPGIKAAILKYHGNYLEVRKKLNEPIIQNKAGYWEDFNKVKSALIKLEEYLGTFPTQEQIDELGELGLYQGIIKYHGGLTEVRDRLGYKPRKKSNLEIRYKSVLNSYVDDKFYYDNRRKSLYTYFDIELLHPITGNFLEIDRYYPHHRVAIEIQGDQHNKENKYFAKMKKKSPKEYLDEIRKVDISKKQQCEAQNIILIELFEDMTKEEIIKKIEKHLPIRKEPLRLSSTTSQMSLEEQIIEQLKYLQSQKEGYVTKNDVVKYSRSLYDDIRLLFNGIYNAREAAGISQPYN